MYEIFRRLSNRVADKVGSPPVFIIAVLIVALWAFSGPLFHYSDSWQLVINTGTTIITFLMVFLIQNTQNRDAKAMHLKLDELIRAIEGARNQLIDLQNSPEENIELLGKEAAQVREETISIVTTANGQCNGAEEGAGTKLDQNK